MKFKFKNAVLPCNEKEDFTTNDPSVDIICRIYLAEAPEKRYEKIAKELDKENYRPDCFFIEAIAGKNFPDESFVTSGWILCYTLDNGEIHNFGYIADEVAGAWEFFRNEIGVEF